MQYLVGIGIVIGIIYLIIRYVIPVIAIGLLIVLGIGGAVGLLVGIFYGVKNYWLSISGNIKAKPMKITMMVITIVTSVALLFGTTYLFITIGNEIAEKNAIEKVAEYKSSGIKHAVNSSYDRAITEFSNAIQATRHQDKDLAILHELRGRAQIAKLAGSATLMGDNFSEIGVTRPEKLSKYTLDRAIADFSTAIRLDPENAVYYRERGRAYNWKDEDDKALDDFNYAIRLNPNYAIVHNNIGILCAHKNDDSMAVESYSRTIQIDPNFKFAYRNRAGVYAKNNNYDKAISDLQMALRIDPNYTVAQKALKTVQRDKQRYNQTQRRNKR